MARILLVASFVILIVSVSLSLLTLEDASANRDQIETAAREALSRVRPSSSGQADQPLSAVRTSPHTYEAAIVNLGGAGVSLRSDCSDEARVEGGIPEGVVVQVLIEGELRCPGWSLVLYRPAPDVAILTWIREQYLALGGQRAPVGFSLPPAELGGVD